MLRAKQPQQSRGRKMRERREGKGRGKGLREAAKVYNTWISCGVFVAQRLGRRGLSLKRSWI